MQVAINKHVNCYPLIYKIKVINAYKNTDKNAKEIAYLFGISRSSIFNWVKLLNMDKLTEKKKYTKISKITSQIKYFIKNYVIRKIYFDYKKLIKTIKNKFKINICKSSIYNVLHKLHITYKKIKKKKIYGNQKKLKNKIKNFKKKIKKININDIISVDEVSFDTNISAEYGWNYSGKRIHKNIGATWKRYTAICAITNKKVLNVHIIRKSAKREDFLNFIKKVMTNIKNKYFLLDNASIHHAKIIKECVSKTTNELLFNAPYSPEFNPIEKIFSKIKTIVRYKNNNNNEHILLKNIHSAFKKITKTNLDNCFKKSLVSFE